MELGEHWIVTHTIKTDLENETDEDDDNTDRKQNRGRPATVNLSAPKLRTKGAMHMP